MTCWKWTSVWYVVEGWSCLGVGRHGGVVFSVCFGRVSSVPVGFASIVVVVVVVVQSCEA